MERLTYRDADTPFVNGLGQRCEALTDCELYEVVNRLASYEDTDLTPDGVELMKDALVNTQRYLHERFKTWNEANKEGRLVILPVKIGDKIYRIEKGKGVRILASHVVEKIEIGTSGVWLCFGWRNLGYETVRDSEIGKTIFLTPQEGTDALKGGSDAD